MYVYIFLFPENQSMYYIAFAFANGPMAWALPLTGNLFVLHSIDKLTSVFIHFTPLVLMWNLHWQTQYSEKKTWAFFDAKQDTLSFTFVGNYLMAAVAGYLIWAVTYYIIINFAAKKRIRDRGHGILSV